MDSYFAWFRQMIKLGKSRDNYYDIKGFTTVFNAMIADFERSIQ